MCPAYVDYMTQQVTRMFLISNIYTRLLIVSTYYLLVLNASSISPQILNIRALALAVKQPHV